MSDPQWAHIKVIRLTSSREIELFVRAIEDYLSIAQVYEGFGGRDRAVACGCELAPIESHKKFASEHSLVVRSLLPINQDNLANGCDRRRGEWVRSRRLGNHWHNQLYNLHYAPPNFAIPYFVGVGDRSEIMYGDSLLH